MAQKPLGEVIELEVRSPVETRVLGHIRRIITTLAEDMNFSPEDVEKIELAVDEACTNVVRHAYKHLGVSPDLPPEERQPPGTECVLRVRTVLYESAMEIQVIDYGIGLRNAPKGVNSIDEYLERKGTGGLGNYIIRNFMDEVSYDYPEDRGTVLTMTKYLTPAAN